MSAHVNYKIHKFDVSVTNLILHPEWKIIDAKNFTIYQLSKLR